MAYKNPEQKAQYDAQFHKNTYRPILMRVRNDSGIWEALFKMQDRTGIAPATYAQNALREKLIKEGYLEEKTE